MSPEQLAGKKVDGRSDLYSLGVMLFQMLAGVLPFRGDSMAELMYKIANQEAPDIRIVRNELPESLANLVALSVSKRPETRYQDGDQFAADLRSVLAEITGGAPATQAMPLSASVPLSASAPLSAAAPLAPPPAGHEKTAVFATAAVAPAAAADFEKTLIQQLAQPARPSADFEKTAVHQTHVAKAPAAAQPAAPDIEI